jgi:hypothetical protein
MEELGLTYAGWKKKKAQEEAAIEEVEENTDEFIYKQNISWDDEAVAI